MLVRRNIVTCIEAMEWCVGHNISDIGTHNVLNSTNTNSNSDASGDTTPITPSNKHGGLVYQIVNINKQADCGHIWVWEHVQMVI